MIKGNLCDNNGNGDNGRISDCTAFNNSGYGISANIGSITNSTANSDSIIGIFANYGSVANSTASDTTYPDLYA